MPRKLRCYLPDIPCHIVHRGNNRQACFFRPQDQVFYLSCLLDASLRYGCAIHSYVLMTNHVHLLATPRTTDGISRMMQSVGCKYVRYVNAARARTGTMWEGRHKASLIDSDNYLFTCYRYIELNPVRAGIVADPASYRWSSYRANVDGAGDLLVQPHPLYSELGDGPVARRAAYRELFAERIEDKDLELLRNAANSCTPVGSQTFKKEIDQRLSAPVSYLPRGRPSTRDKAAPPQPPEL